MKINLNWPATPQNVWNPWYVIVWRVLWAIPVYFGLSIAFVGMLFAHGPREALNWWDFVS